MSSSQEEEIARDYICFGSPDVTVVVIDATCLERNLNLVYQTMELTPNVIVCVNLLDEAKKKGIFVDLEKLSLHLGVPVVGTVARKKKSLKQLLSLINDMAVGNVKASPRLARYSNDIEDAIDTLTPSIVKLLPDKYKYISRWIALKLMDNDPKILNSIKKHLSIELFSEEIIDKLFTISSVISNIANFRNTLVSSIIQKAEDINKKVCILRDKNYNIRDRKIDKILTSKKFGIPIMLLFSFLILYPIFL